MVHVARYQQMNIIWPLLFIVPPVVEKFSEDLHNRYKDIRKKPQRIEWPPYQPKSIVNVTVIHYKNKQTRQELLEISEHFKTGASGVSKLMSAPPSHSKVTKDVNEIFKVDPADQTDDIQSEPVKVILIEGAPGIGKTMLAKEIAYLWADHKLLTECNLVLLVFLRDPRVHKMKSIEELLQLYTTEKEATEVIDYLKKTSGQTVGFVFDGFDEFPISESSIVADIIGISNDYGRKFCKSIVVVTSRPTATLFLQTIVDRRIEILGFAPEERDKLISQSISQFPLKKIQLEKYFKQHPIISSLCYIPLNLAILLYLFHQGNLPATLTDMNETFVIHTIYRHLKRLSLLSGYIYHLKDMPENIIQILDKISKLAFEKLQNNQLVFTESELKDVCPEVYDVQEAANGLSLLQAVEHHPQRGVGTTTSFNFLHLTMQEYLAAYYVSTLPEEQQLELLQNKFWDGHFNFMWIMYVGTVGVKSGAFASFVRMMNIEQKKCIGRKAFNLIQQDKMKCLHLFQCYMEANSNAEIPQAISSIFANGIISLTGITLLSHHVTSLLLFMSTSVQQWKTLELNKCNLQQTEMNNLLQNAINNKESMLTLDYVDLSENNSSPWGVYCVLIAHCRVNSLTLCGDEGMNEYIEEITDSLQANTTLRSLTLCSIGKIGVKSIKAVLLNKLILKRLNLSWQKSKDLRNILTHTTFSSNTNDAMQTKSMVKDTNRVVNVNILYIGDVSHTRSPSSFSNIISTQNYGSKTVINLSCNLINDDAVYVLAFGLCNNKKVEQLNISNNNITDEGAIAIIDCLKHNTKLKKLDLSQNKININGMNKMFKNIESQGTTLSLEYVDLSKNSSTPWGVYCAIIRHCCINSLTLCGDEGMKEYIKEITDSLQANTMLLSLTLCSIGKIGAESIKELSMNNFTLEKLNLSWQKLSSESKKKTLMHTAFLSSTDATVDVSIILYDGDISFDFFVSSFSGICSTQIFEPKVLTVINLSGKYINDDAVHVLAFGLCNNTTVEQLNISNNRITDEGAIAIIDCLKHNKTLKKLDLSQNLINIDGMKKILENIESLVTTISLQYVDLSKNDSSPWGVYCAIIGHCSLNSLTLCGDEGMEEYIKEITGSLQANTIIQSLTLYNIKKVGVESIKAVLTNNFTLKNVNLSWHRIKGKDMEKILTHTSLLPNMDDIIQNRTTTSDINRVINVNILYDELVSLNQFISSFSNVDIQNYESETETVINLSCDKVNDDAAHVLAFGLCNNTTVGELNISDNNISDEGAIAIIDSLKHNKTIKKLHLSKNKISDNGMKQIMENIENHKTSLSLEYVDLSKNQASPWDVYCTIIKYSCVNNLTLCGDEEMKEYIKEIVKSLQLNQTLQSLTLLGVDKDHLELLQNALNFYLLQSKVASSINKHTIVINSNVSYDQCSPTTINVSINIDINDDDVTDLMKRCNKTKIEKFNISHNNITDNGVAAICECLKCNGTLKELDLSQNKIGIIGMNKIIENIENQETCSSLEYVDLSKNQASPWAVYCAIIKHSCVNNLTLCGDEEMKENIKEIGKSLQLNTTLQSLTLPDVNKHHLELLQSALNFYLLQTKVAIAINEHVIVINSYDQCSPTTINVSNININDDDVIDFVKRCNNANIEKLNISHNDITDNGVAAICECLKCNETLKELDLSRNKISINGMNNMLGYIENQVKTLSLQYVDLSGNQASPWGVYCAIVRHCYVNDLTLCGDEGMQEYIKDITYSLQANKTLQSLTLCSIGKIGVKSIKAILLYDHEYTIKRINLSWQKINIIDAGSTLTHKLFSFHAMDAKKAVNDGNMIFSIYILYHIDVIHSSLDISFSDTACTPNLELNSDINLSSKRIDDDAAHVLAFGLCNNTTVEELNISLNEISDEGAIAIFDCLKYNKTLKKLDLSQNKLYSSMTLNLQKYIEEKRITLSLESINLRRNFSSPWAVYCAIIRHSNVNSLTLCGDKRMKEYIKEIAKSLQLNTTIQSLTLLDAPIHDLELLENALYSHRKGACAVNEHTIVMNSDIPYDEYSPTTIDVSNFNVNDDDVIDLVKRYSNAKIRKLNISHNDVTDNGVVAICDCLKCNATLEELNLSQNKISIIGMNKMIENIENQGISILLEYVDLSKNQASPWDVYCTIIKYSCVNNLTLCGDEEMKEYIKEIAKSLQLNQTLQSLTLLGVDKDHLELLQNALNFYLLQSKVASSINKHTIVIKSNVSYDQCSPTTINVSINIDINDDDVTDLMKRCNKTKIEKFNISHNNITDNGVAAICECLKCNGTLKELDLSQNKIGIIGMNKIIENIENQETCSSLEYVDLSKNQASAWAVYCTIIKHSCVNSLTLCGDEKMKENTKEIAKNLQVNTALQSLTLLGVTNHHLELLQNTLNFYFSQTKIANIIHEHTIVMNSNVSIDDCKLTTINVFNININDDDIIGLVKWINLTKLNISDNDITDIGVVAICECLKCNKMLKELDLSQNKISINGMNKMVEIIENQITSLLLEYVDLSKNQASPWTVYCTIIKHSCVNSLTLCGDEEMRENIKEIAKSLKVNTTLKSLTLPDVTKHNLELLRHALNFYLLQTKVLIAINEHTNFNVSYDQCSPAAINVPNININDDDVIDFVKQCNNAKIEKLNISHNDVTDTGVVAICECLKCNETLKELDLSQNEISVNGMNSMLEFIEKQVKTLSLQYVDLSENQASPWGVYCAIVKHCYVNDLTLCGDEGMQEYIKDITYSLQANKILQSLTLCSIGKIGVKSIKEVLLYEYTLKRINLSWQKINMICERSRLTLKLFSFHANNPMDAKKTVNDSNMNIGVYILYHTDSSLDISFSDTACAENLESNSVINLSSKCIDDDAAHVLAFGLCNNTTVEELNISLNEISDEGAIAIFDCLKYNKTLKKLDLSQNKLYSSMMLNLQKYIEENRITLSLEYVDLRRNIVSSPWGVYCAIIRHSNVNSLTLCGDEKMKENTKEIAKSLQVNTTLQSLALPDVNEHHLELLRNTLSFYLLQTKVTIAINEHTNSNVSYYQCSPATINVSNININDDDVIDLVKRCNTANIEKLNISHNDITDNGVVAICECLKCNETLKELDLSQNKIGIVGMNKIIKYIENQGTFLFLEYVDLSKNQASPWGVYCTIIKHSCVNSLTLSGDEEMKENIKNVAKSLRVNTTLQSLTLPDVNKHHLELLRNALNFYLLQTKVANAIYECTIVINSYDQCSPTTINVSNININDDDVINLVKRCNNPKIEQLNISHNNITDNGVVAICDCLKCNETLKELDLSQNEISVNGMNNMLEFIEKQVKTLSLQYVDLSENQASPWGVYCAIVKHCYVNDLTLCGDEGMQEYIKDITYSLQTNKTLQSLTLCSIGKIGVKSIKAVLLYEYTLKRINLSWQKINMRNKRSSLTHKLFSFHANDAIDAKITVNDNNMIFSIYILYHIDVIHSSLDISFSDTACAENLESNRVINLSSKCIDDNAAHVLAFGLCNNTTVEELNISLNEISDEGAIAIFDCLNYNKTLKKLDLSQNKLYFSMMLNMQKYIEEKRITLSLEYVDLRNNISSSWAVYCAIIRHSNVTSLTLCGNERMKEYIKEIAKSLQLNLKIESLTLLDANIHDLELLQNALSSQRKGAHAVNEHTIVINSGVPYDEYSPTSIDVSNFSVNDDDVMDLVKQYSNAKIEKLNVSHNDITDNGVVAICECLKCNETLKELDLSQNKIGIIGMNKIIESIENQRTSLLLEYVDLSKNQASPWGVYCAIVRHCDVNDLTLCGDEGMQEYIVDITYSLQANTTLQSLVVHDVEENEVQLIKNALNSLSTSLINTKYFSLNTLYSSTNRASVHINAFDTVSYNTDYEHLSKIADLSNHCIDNDVVDDDDDDVDNDDDEVHT